MRKPVSLADDGRYYAPRSPWRVECYAGPGWLDRLEAQEGVHHWMVVRQRSGLLRSERRMFGALKAWSAGVEDWIARIDALPVGLPRDDVRDVLRWSLDCGDA